MGKVGGVRPHRNRSFDIGRMTVDFHPVSDLKSVFRRGTPTKILQETTPSKTPPPLVLREV